MTWKIELEEKRADANIGSAASAVLDGIDNFKESSEWPDDALSLSRDVLQTVEAAFSKLHQYLQGLASKLDDDPPPGFRDNKLEEKSLKDWLTNTLGMLGVPEDLCWGIVVDLGLPLKPKELVDKLSEFQKTAKKAADAAKELIDAKAFETTPNSAETGAGQASSKQRETGNQVEDPADPLSSHRFELEDFLERLAPDEPHDKWITTLASIARKLRDDGITTITLVEIYDKIAKIKLSEVHGDKLTPKYRGSLSTREEITRSELKRRALRIFEEKFPEIKARQEKGVSTDTDGGSEDGKNKRAIGVFQKVVVGGVVLVALLLLGSVFAAEISRIPGLLHNFSNNEIARGFITLTFVVGAISIFLIVTTIVVFEEKSYPKDVYERAKTILSMILGILGTVIGFYFGTSDSDEGVVAEPAFALEILQPKLTPSDLGYTLDIGAFASGSEGPFRFTVSLLEPDGSVRGDGPFTFVSATGALSETVPALDFVAGAELLVEFIALDADKVAVAKTSASVEVPANQ